MGTGGRTEHIARSVRGLRRVRRPATASGPEFDLHYVRQPATGARPAGLPIVIIPGGPGLGSLVLFAGLRARAARAGLYVIMIEHRGIGLSRCDTDGADLPREAMRVAAVADDIAAVLDAESVPEAVLAGSSYGTYAVQAFAADHPERTAALVLDSAMIDASFPQRIEDYSLQLLFEGHRPAELGEIGPVPGIAGPVDPAADLPETERVAMKIRDLAGSQLIGQQDLGRMVRTVFEFAGVGALDRLLNQIALGRAGWTQALLTKLTTAELESRRPHIMEFDLVGEIAVRELGYALPGRGSLFDSSADFGDAGGRFTPFAGEPYDLPAALKRLQAPVTVISGNRDLRTPRSIAARIAADAPDGALIPVADHGHSALDTHAGLFLAVVTAHAAGRRPRADELAAASRRRSGSGSHRLGGMLRASLLADRLRPASQRPGQR